MISNNSTVSFNQLPSEILAEIVKYDENSGVAFDRLKHVSEKFAELAEYVRPTLIKPITVANLEKLSDQLKIDFNENILECNVTKLKNAQDFKRIVQNYPNLQTLSCRRILFSVEEDLITFFNELAKLKDLKDLRLHFKYPMDFITPPHFIPNDGNIHLLVRACPNLTKLEIDYTQLTDAGFVTLTRLSQLEKLALKSSDLAFVPNENELECFPLMNLIHLNLSRNTLLHPNFFRKCRAFPKLETLNLKKVSVQNDDNDDWVQLRTQDPLDPHQVYSAANAFSLLPPQIKHLNLTEMYQVALDSLIDIQRFESIESLTTNGPNSVTNLPEDKSHDIQMQGLLTFKNLKYLHLIFRYDYENLDELLKLNQIKTLEILEVSFSDMFSSKLLPILFGLKVKKLILNNFKLQGPVLEEMQIVNTSIESIQYKNIKGNSFFIPHKFCPNIKELIFQCPFQVFRDADIFQLTQFQNLEKLVFNEDNLDERIEINGKSNVEAFLYYHVKLRHPNVDEVVLTTLKFFQNNTLNFNNVFFKELVFFFDINHKTISHLNVSISSKDKPRDCHLTMDFQKFFPNLESLTYEGPVLDLTITDLTNIKSIRNLKNLTFIINYIEEKDGHKQIFKKSHKINNIQQFLTNKISELIEKGLNNSDSNSGSILSKRDVRPFTVPDHKKKVK